MQVVTTQIQGILSILEIGTSFSTSVKRTRAARSA
jgi:hypothetical protein